MDLEPFLAASATVTKAVDFIRNAVDPGGKLPRATWNLVAFATGILAAYTTGLLIAGFTAWQTGLAIGASASGFHEVFDFFGSKAKQATPPPIESSNPQTEA